MLMYRLLHYFAFGALLAFVTAGIVITWLVYRMEFEEHIQVGEREHVAIARVIQNSLSDAYLPLIEGPAVSDQRSAGHRARLATAIERLLRDSGVLQLKLYDLDGNVAFVSNDDVDHREHDEPDAAGRVQRALLDGVYSELVDVGRHAEFGPRVKNVLQTYIAIRPRRGAPLGVIELYSDITEQINEIHHETTVLGSSLAAVLCALYVVLLLIVRHAEGIIRQRDKERSEYLEKLEQAKIAAEAGSRAKSEFLANIGHEVRTPMNVVLGAADLLQHSSLDEQQSKFVQTISHSGETLLALIDNILNLSSIDTGSFAAQNRKFRVAEVIDALRNMFAGMAEARGLSLHFKISVPDDELYGDPAHLRMVLSNLLDNAIKFTDQGKVAVKVTVARAQPDVQWLRFEVSDSGIGIGEEHFAQILESFTQLDGSSRREYQGAGLGLAIANRLVGIMGGELSIDSKPGGGSKFSFVLGFPLASAVTASASACAS